MILTRQKVFTKYDDTDRLKQMKDSDLLAEKIIPVSKYHKKAIISSGVGAAVGSAVGALFHKKFNLDKKKASKLGAAVGAVLGLGKSELKNAKKIQEIKDYNSRLEYAQYQAKRREKKDWVRNMTQRDGYSY